MKPFSANACSELLDIVVRARPLTSKGFYCIILFYYSLDFSMQYHTWVEILICEQL